MTDIDDDELILFHYRDGLSAQRLAHIERQLDGSASLRERHARLRAILAAVDREADLEAAPGFEQRLWRGLQARMNESVAAAREVDAGSRIGARAEDPARARRSVRQMRWGLGFAAAAAVALSVGILFFQNAPRDPAQASQAERLISAGAVAERVLTMRVAEHLRSTEAVLLTVLNDADGTLAGPARGELLASMVQDNRLYSAAAARRGDRALAGFLQSLQSILIELANQASGGRVQVQEELREFVSSTDLLFQVRAVEAHLRTGSSSA